MSRSIPDIPKPNPGDKTMFVVCSAIIVIGIAWLTTIVLGAL